ncbi:MAG: peptide-methionine (S)-S-oxide reductase MsrA [Candidatus Tectimicrobiota bacterium]
MSERREVITLGGGCFWCVEAVYQELKGVESAVSGYAGGAVAQPTYQQVCSGSTGHAEVVQITFDPEVIALEDILYVFWRTHDPTTLNRQGYDVGTQYRSIIMYHTEPQRLIAEQSKRETDAARIWANPIVTEISPATVFYPAEDYHQNYYRSNPYQPYCRAIIDPKMQKLRKEMKDKLRATV